MDGDSAQDGLDKGQLASLVHEPGFPGGKPPGHLVDDGLQLGGGGAPQRERDAQVRDREVDDGAPQVLDDVGSIFGVTPNQGRSALLEVHVQAGGAPKELQDLLHRRGIIRRWVAQENDVVGVKGYGRDGAARVELLHGSELDRAMKEPAQRIDGKDEELRGNWITLAQSAAVPNCGSWVAVEENLRAGRRQEKGNPTKKAVAKAMASQHLEQERPRDGVKSPRQVKLQERARGTKLVQKPHGLTHQDEVVMKASARDEGILDFADEAIELGREAE